MDSFGGHLGFIGVTFGGSLEVLLVAVGCLRGPLWIPGGSWEGLGRLGGDFRDFPGNSGRPFGSILRSFLVFFNYFFGVCFLTNF